MRTGRLIAVALASALALAAYVRAEDGERPAPRSGKDAKPAAAAKEKTGALQPKERPALREAETREPAERQPIAAERPAREARPDVATEKDAKPRNWKTWDPGVNQRQRNQLFRIAHGIRKGSLTRDEVKTIMDQERAIAQLERDMKSDGKLTVEERKQLHQLLNETSRMIYVEKHDDETAPPLRPKVNEAIKARIESGEMTREEAKELCAQMRRIRELKRTLGGTERLPAKKRAELEAEFDNLNAILHE